MLGHSLAAQPKLHNGSLRSGEPHDERWSNSWRHEAGKSVGNSRDLRDCRRNLSPRLEEYLDNANAGERLRLQVFNVIDVGGVSAFRKRDDALFHIGPGEAVVKPHHADHGNIDDRQDIGGGTYNGKRTQNGNEKCHYDKGVSAAEGEAYYPHAVIIPAVFGVLGLTLTRRGAFRSLCVQCSVNRENPPTPSFRRNL